MARKLEVEIVGDASSLKRAFGQASGDTGKLGKAFGSLTKAGLLAGAALGGAAVIGIKKSITAASDLTEQINKASVVFRGSEKEVVRWSGGLAESFGLSSRAALEAAGTFGNMLVPMGFARDAAAEMSQRLTELGGDMASFNNASIEDTLLAIRSGLAGETEPLRKFGVFLSAARVQEEALAETHKKNAKSLTTAEKATAAYNIILKDTKDTQGDFARSAGGSLANQIRILEAQFENLAASLGKALLPAVIKVLGWINDKVIPGLGNAADAVKEFWTSIQKGFAKAPDFKAKVRVVFENVKELAGRFVDAVAGTIEGLLPHREIPLNFKMQHRGGESAAGGVDWDAVASDMIAALAVALEQSAELAQALGETINQAIGKVNWSEAGKKIAPGLVTMMATAISIALDPSFWIKNWELALSIAAVVFRAKIAEFAVKAAGFLGAAMVGILSKISPTFAAAFGRFIEDAGRVALAAFDRIGKNLFRLAEALFGKLTKAAVFTIKVLGITAAINAVVQFGKAVIDKLKEVLGWFSQVPGKIQAVFSDAGSWLYNAGLAVLQGFWDGLKSKWEAVAGWVGGLGGQIRNLKGPPSKDAVLLKDIGELVMLGFQHGLQDGWDNGVAPFLDKLSDKIGDKVGKAIDNAAKVISSKRSVFQSAFDALLSTALEAFDKIASEIETKTEKQIRLMDEKAKKQGLKQDIKDAKSGLAAAQTALGGLTQGEEESAEDFAARMAAAQQAVLDAQKQLDDALAAQQRYRLEQRAAQERKDLNDRLALKRKHFEDELAALQSSYERGKISAREFHERLVSLFKEYHIPYKKGAQKLGLALAEGLTEAFKDVAAAAKALANAILDQFSKIKVVINVDLSVKGGGKGIDGKRAMGGPVNAGGAYLIGEQGPELFLPNESGMVVPNSKMNAYSGGGASNITINMPNYLGRPEEVAAAVRDELLKMQRRGITLGFA